MQQNTQYTYVLIFQDKLQDLFSLSDILEGTEKSKNPLSFIYLMKHDMADLTHM